MFGERSFGVASYDTRARASRRREFVRVRAALPRPTTITASRWKTAMGDTRLSGRLGYVHTRYEARPSTRFRVSIRRPAPPAKRSLHDCKAVIGYADGAFGAAHRTFFFGIPRAAAFFMVRQPIPTLVGCPRRYVDGSAPPPPPGFAVQPR